MSACAYVVARVERTVHLGVVLSEEDATILCSLLGGIGNNPEALKGIFGALDASLPKREQSFRDFFEFDDVTGYLSFTGAK